MIMMWMSEKRKLQPVTCRSAKAKLMVVQDFPTPPFADETRITCLTPGMGNLIGSPRDIAVVVANDRKIKDMTECRKSPDAPDAVVTCCLLSPAADASNAELVFLHHHDTNSTASSFWSHRLTGFQSQVFF